MTSTEAWNSLPLPLHKQTVVQQNYARLHILYGVIICKDYMRVNEKDSTGQVKIPYSSVTVPNSSCHNNIQQYSLF
jgi:hypothetical protein